MLRDLKSILHSQKSNLKVCWLEGDGRAGGKGRGKGRQGREHIALGEGREVGGLELGEADPRVRRQRGRGGGRSPQGTYTVLKESTS